MLALIKKEWTINIRRLHEVLQPTFFLLILITLFSIAIGPEPTLLARLAPAIIWVGVLLSVLLVSEKIYKNDFEDGSLIQFYLSGQGLFQGIFVKLGVTWVVSILPLIVMTPVLAVLYQMDWKSLWVLSVTLLIASPVVLMLGMLGAAITLSIKRGGLLLLVVIMPFYVPILVFAIAAVNNSQEQLPYIGQLAILTAGLFFALTILPFAIHFALKSSLAVE